MPAPTAAAVLPCVVAFLKEHGYVKAAAALVKQGAAAAEVEWTGAPLLSLLPEEAFALKVKAKKEKEDREAVKGKKEEVKGKKEEVKGKQEEVKGKKEEVKEKKEAKKEKEDKCSKGEAKIQEAASKAAVAIEKDKEAKADSKAEGKSKKGITNEAGVGEKGKVKAKKENESEAGKHNGSDDALGSKAKVIADSSAAAKCKADEPKSKSKKSKEAPAASPRQSPRLAASGSGGVVPAVDIGKKRRLDAAAEEPAAAGGGSKSGSRAGTPFKRVDESEWVGSQFHVTKDNSYFALGLDQSEYGAKAAAKLATVRGKDFRHEKTKRKRSYVGGKIDMSSHSIKFSNSDDEN